MATQIIQNKPCNLDSGCLSGVTMVCNTPCRRLVNQSINVNWNSIFATEFLILFFLFSFCTFFLFFKNNFQCFSYFQCFIFLSVLFLVFLIFLINSKKIIYNQSINSINISLFKVSTSAFWWISSHVGGGTITWMVMYRCPAPWGFWL